MAQKASCPAGGIFSRYRHDEGRGDLVSDRDRRQRHPQPGARQPKAGNRELQDQQLGEGARARTLGAGEGRRVRLFNNNRGVNKLCVMLCQVSRQLSVVA